MSLKDFVPIRKTVDEEVGHDKYTDKESTIVMAFHQMHLSNLQWQAVIVVYSWHRCHGLK